MTHADRLCELHMGRRVWELCQAGHSRVLAKMSVLPPLTMACSTCCETYCANNMRYCWYAYCCDRSSHSGTAQDCTHLTLRQRHMFMRLVNDV